ncbi:MAG: hypothetical protein QF535_09745, partial [Anaerolineales bacterium]|nr:hypothetical protein [Anaerolineales bacterium]
LTFGGDIEPGKTVNTEFYNGTSWTEVNNLVQKRRSYARAGTTGLGLYTTGDTHPGVTAVTEEWTAPIANETITVS